MKMRAAIAALGVALAVTSAAAGAPYKVPRTALGQPDLQGVWNTDFLLPVEATPLTRSLVISEAEAKALAPKIAAIAANVAVFRIDGEVAERLQAASVVGLGKVRGERRTRQVVDPVDGKIPWTPQAGRQVRFFEQQLNNNPNADLPTDNPEQRPSGERCLAQFGQAPVFNVADINPRKILQTRDHVVIQMEYGAEVRIVPFAREHGPAALSSVFGDSIARWEGDTLVIETVRAPARDQLRLFPVILISDKATVIERYTRLGPVELLYQYMVVDPANYATPWRAEYSLAPVVDRMFEFACHEGNYSLPNILGAARHLERERAAAKKP
jgi:hypothetical protein